MNYRIIPVMLARFTDMEESTFTYLKNFGTLLQCPILVFVVQGNGENILFDSGPVSPELAPSKTHRPMMDHISMQEGLAKIGLRCEDIDCVVLSHLHWDHSYNLELFPHAPIYIQGKEVEYAINPLPCSYVSYNVRNGNGVPQWLDGFENFRLLYGDYQLGEGLELVCLPGHTPGQQGLVVDTAEGKYLLSSDHYPLMDNYLMGIPSGIHVDLTEWQASHRKVLEKGWKVLPAHDDCVLERKVYG